MEEAGQMRPPDTEVPPHRVRSRRGPGGGADRLSALPDDMLLLVLARLRCARRAARTGVLSRRWRGLWTRLPDLTFRGVAPTQIEAALAGLAASPWVSKALDIKLRGSHCTDDAHLTSLLHAAARFSPQELLFSSAYDGSIEEALPCFPRATSIEIDSSSLICFTQLPAGEFPALEILSLKECNVTYLGALVALCPRLRVLMVTAYESDFVVHSASLQTLDVGSAAWWHSIDIVTPMLKHLTMFVEADTELSVSISAPMVERLDWECNFTELALMFGFWRLENMGLVPTRRDTYLDYGRKEYTCSQLHPVHALHLELDVAHVFFYDGDLDSAQDMDLAQEIEKLPVTDFSILKLTLRPHGHVFGALVLRLFGLHQICAVTKCLIVVIPDRNKRQECPENCPCDEPKNWRCQSISLTGLEEVQIGGFTGEADEHDFLKMIFRSSPMLNRVTLKLVPEFGGSIKEIYDNFSANPSVKGCVYDSDGGLVRQPSD